jgi:hypothetical protein
MGMFDQEQYDTAKSVAGRVAAIEDTNSPLMQRAKTRATQQANQLGLRNSSIAVGAAQNAVLDAATPIATADAQIGEQGRQFDTGLKENTRQFDTQLGENTRQFDVQTGEQRRQFDTQLGEGARQFGETIGLQREQLATTKDQFGRQLAENTRQFDAGQGQQKLLAEMDAANRLQLAEIQYGNQEDIASNENISRAWGTMTEAVNRIQNNPDLNAKTKKTLIANQIAGFQSFTNFWKKASGGAVDVTDLLSFGAAESGDTEARANPPQTPAGGYVAPWFVPSWQEPTGGA